MDVGIIRTFKLKYRKLRIRYVISRVDDDKRASDIINEISILKVINWVKSAWREVTSDIYSIVLKNMASLPMTSLLMKTSKFYSIKYQKIVLLTNMLR